MKDIVLITGASGYLGGRIAAFLSNKNKFFLRLTSIKRTRKPAVLLKNCEIVRFNLLAQDNFKILCKGVKFIIHLAALNSLECESDPEKALRVNVLGTFRLLKVAEEQGIRRFIYFSTAHIYGSPLSGRITEKNVPKPTHPYAITHFAAEDLVLCGQNLAGIVLRLSNAVGAPVNPEVNCWSLIANDLCRQAVSNKKLILKTPGLQKRDFVTIKDVCRAVYHMLELGQDKCSNEIFNLGGEKSLSIIDLTKKIANRCRYLLGFYPEIIKPESRPSDVSLPLDYRIDKLKAMGFKLIGSLEEEIDATLKFCQHAFGRKS